MRDKIASYIPSSPPIQAVQWSGENLDEVKLFIGENPVPSITDMKVHDEDHSIVLMTSHGIAIIDKGAYLYRLHDGAYLNSSSAEVFEAAWKPMEGE